LKITPFENFITLRNVGMLMEEVLAKETPTKANNTWKGNY